MVDGISLADIKAVTDDGNWGNGGGFWVLILFVLLLGNGGMWGNNGRYATTGDVERGFYQQTNEGMLRGISNGICDSSYALNNAIKDAGYANTVAIKDARCELGGIVKDARFDVTDRIAAAHTVTDAGIAALGAQMAQCCCENKTLQLENKYELSNAIHQEGEKTRALIQENKIETLQGKINQLELQAAMCGVVRYPNQFVYSAGNSPFCGCNCGANYYGTTF